MSVSHHSTERTGDEPTERAVTSHIAKYVTKPEVAGVTVDRPIRDYLGHTAAKSRRYSTTYTALRAALDDTHGSEVPP